jgi:hypothetical protein
MKELLFIVFTLFIIILLYYIDIYYPNYKKFSFIIISIIMLLDHCILIYCINSNKNKINLLTLSKNQRLINSDNINLNPYLYEELYEQLNRYTSYINNSNDTGNDEQNIYDYLKQIISGHIQLDKLFDNKYYQNLNVNQQIYFTNLFKKYNLYLKI